MKTVFKSMKRSTAVLLVPAFLVSTSLVAYAVSQLFFNRSTQTSDYEKKTYFEFSISNVFTESGAIGSGESKTINPVITSDATEDMYVVIRVEMPTI